MGIKTFFCQIQRNQFSNIIIIVYDKNFLFSYHIYSPLFFEFYNCNTGITFTELSDAEKEAFRAKMGPVYDLVKKKAGEEIVKKVLQATN